MVVDFREGQETTFLAQLDQGLELLATTLQLFFAGFGVGRESVLQQGLFLGLAILGLGLVGRLQFGTLDGVQCGNFIALGLEFLGLAATAARHLDARQHIAGRVDGCQGSGISGLAYARRSSRADVFAFHLCGFGGLGGLGFGFLGGHGSLRRFHRNRLFGGLR